MKPLEFEGNEQDCSFTYFRVREGPNYFVSHYKGSTRGHNDPKDCWRVLGVAKFTDSGKQLKDWCLEMDSTYNTPNPDGLGSEPEASGRKDTSFASEAMAEPTEQTRMVT
jgi:hypothetical protein